MEEYRPPKLIGKKAPLNCLVLPDQHYTAWKATQRYNMSFGEYVGALIDRAEGRPNKLDGMQQGALPIEESQDTKKPKRGDALKRAKDEALRIADGFAPYVRAVVRIPYDPALVNGPIRYEALQPATQRAWLAAAAAVAKGF